MSKVDDETELHTDFVLKRLQNHPLWTLNDENKLSRKFRSKNFKSSLDFVAALGAIANKHEHHPDIHIVASKEIEIVVYTQPVNGITEKDFKMIQLYDDIPVNYSLFWKKQNEHRLHGSMVDVNSPNKHSHDSAALPVVHVSELPHNKHQTRHLPHLEPTVPAHSNEHSVHNSPDAFNRDGSRMHNHVFRVHTGHTAPIGDSEIGHTMEHIKYNHEHMHHINTQADMHEVSAGFDLLVRSLQVCLHHGYDHGICETLLPMLEEKTVHDSMYDEMKSAHAHFKHRVSDWVKEEPRAIVDASHDFLRGYEMISKAYINLE